MRHILRPFILAAVAAASALTAVPAGALLLGSPPAAASTLCPGATTGTFGPNVCVFTPSMSQADVQSDLDAIATHKANVYIDLSGWSPKYFPADLVRAANSYLQDKVLFGTDYPLLTPERWLRDFETLDVKPEAKAKILKANAVKVLDLD